MIFFSLGTERFLRVKKGKNLGLHYIYKTTSKQNHHKSHSASLLGKESE